MAINAVLVKACEDIIDMAACTRYGLMRTGERKFGVCMVERGGCPNVRRVTLIARMCEISA